MQEHVVKCYGFLVVQGVSENLSRERMGWIWRRGAKKSLCKPE